MKLFLFIIVFAVIILITNMIVKSIKRMQPHKGVQESTINLLIHHEEERNDVYKDPVGIDTVGIGHVVLPQDNLKFGDKISDNQIREFLKKDLGNTDWAIKRYVKVPLNQNQYDALTSLIFNIGAGNFASSTVLKFVNAGKNKEEMSPAWKAWNKAKGKILNGLVKRREDELNLFFA